MECIIHIIKTNDKSESCQLPHAKMLREMQGLKPGDVWKCKGCESEFTLRQYSEAVFDQR